MRVVTAATPRLLPFAAGNVRYIAAVDLMPLLTVNLVAARKAELTITFASGWV